MQHYKLAEVAVEAALGSAHQSGEWHLDESAAPAFEKLLSLHDSQLNVAPLYKVIEKQKSSLSDSLMGRRLHRFWMVRP